MSEKYSIDLKYTSIGSLEVEADSYDEAVEKAEKQLVQMHSAGNLASDRYTVSWSDAELKVEHESIDLNDMKYFED